MITSIELFNAFIGLLIFLRAIGHVNHMTPITPHGVRFAIVLVTVAAFGYLVSPLFIKLGDAVSWLQTLLLLAICCYLYADERHVVRDANARAQRCPLEKT